MKRLDLHWLVRRASGKPLRLFLDFDGTLSPTAITGARAVLPRPAREALARLRRGGAFVSIISGRSVYDLKARVKVRNLVYGGNHGLELVGRGALFRHPLADVARRSVRQAGGWLRPRLARYPALELEDKGLSLAVNAGLLAPAQRAAVRRVLESSRDELRGLRLRVFAGKLGWDLVPDLGWDKGDAVAHLMKTLGAGFCAAFGDSDSDETMFQAVERAGGVSVRVGRARGSRARFYVHGPEAVAEALVALAGQVIR